MIKRRRRPKCFQHDFSNPCEGKRSKGWVHSGCRLCGSYSAKWHENNAGFALMNRPESLSTPNANFRCYTTESGVERDCSGGLDGCGHCTRSQRCHCRAKGRMSVGPTGRKKVWMILVDSCLTCGRNYPIHPEQMTHEQTEWIRRWNKRCDEDFLRT